MGLIDCDIGNEPKAKHEEPRPAIGMGYCRHIVADGSAAAEAYNSSIQKSREIRKGIPADGRPSTDSLYFGKV